MKWILVTASFGQENYHDAAERLLLQARAFGLFEKCIHVTEQNLAIFAPKTSQTYGKFLNDECKGFGYYSWKPEIILTVSNLYKDHGVTYIDAGCEMNLNIFTKLRLKFMMKQASIGTYFYTLNYPEKLFSKKKIIDHFKLTPKQQNSPQIQATWFFLSGGIGKKIADIWADTTLISIDMINDSSEDEIDEFVENRYDQSILSCLLKSLGIRSKRHKSCYRPLTLLSSINCYFHPIWSARNRSGTSIADGRRIEK